MITSNYHSAVSARVLSKRSPNANQYINAGNTSNGKNRHSVIVAITNPTQIAGIKNA